MTKNNCYSFIFYRTRLFKFKKKTIDNPNYIILLETKILTTSLVHPHWEPLMAFFQPNLLHGDLDCNRICISRCCNVIIIQFFNLKLEKDSEGT